MKARTLLIAAVVATAAVSVGCNRNKTATARSSGALDITPPTPVYTQPQPVAAAPVAQPVVYDAQPAFASQPTPAPSFNDGGNRYTVKKGDTLFSIAKTRYGNGNQWQKIASANPGLTPQTLKAGQTITIPN